jgi:hypothetical protein
MGEEDDGEEDTDTDADADGDETSDDYEEQKEKREQGPGEDVKMWERLRERVEDVKVKGKSVGCEVAVGESFSTSFPSCWSCANEPFIPQALALSSLPLAQVDPRARARVRVR